MANALLAAAASPGLPALVLPLYDPRLVWADRRRLRSDAPPQLALANSFLCPAGRWPGRGWVLLARITIETKDARLETNVEHNVRRFIRPRLAADPLVRKNAKLQERCKQQAAGNQQQH